MGSTKFKTKSRSEKLLPRRMSSAESIKKSVVYLVFAQPHVWGWITPFLGFGNLKF